MGDEQLETLREKLGNWVEDSISVPGASDPDIDAIFPAEFIEENTDFADLAEFLRAAPFNLEDEEFIGPEVDDFIDERTEYASWQEFQQTAEVEWMKGQV